MGLVIGAAAGFLHLEGFLVIVLGCTAMFLLSSVYNSKFLDVVDEDFKENELLLEGAGNAFGCFMVGNSLSL